MRKFHKISDQQIKKDFKNRTEKDLDIKIPIRATRLSAGYDFFAPFSFELEPGEILKVPTGIKAEMEDDDSLEIMPKSGLGFSYFVRLANTIGLIDADYIYSKNEGHIWIKIRNEGEKTLTIEQGEGFAQGVFRKYLLVDGDDFKTGNDRDGGMGSTKR